jgi:hypothetical protein
MPSPVAVRPILGVWEEDGVEEILGDCVQLQRLGRGDNQQLSRSAAGDLMERTSAAESAKPDEEFSSVSLKL